MGSTALAARYEAARFSEKLVGTALPMYKPTRIVSTFSTAASLELTVTVAK
jgi:hypothetical protein